MLKTKTPALTEEMMFTLMFADVLTAQQTESVKFGLRKKDTIVITFTSGTTSRVQPLDVCINKPFKCYIREHHEKRTVNKNNLYFVRSFSVLQTIITDCS